MIALPKLTPASAAFIMLLMSRSVPAGESMERLAPCPASPNCVSTEADDEHFIAPIPYTGAADAALQRLRDVLAREPRTTVVEVQGNYLHAEARSRVFRFVDDIEFQLEPQRRLIHVRSASRVGYSDFGVNRRRVERIREAFRDLP